MEIDLQNSVLNFESTLENIFRGSSHNSSKIPSWKVNSAGKRPVTRTGHFVARNENGCTESSEICCHKHYEVGL